MTRKQLYDRTVVIVAIVGVSLTAIGTYVAVEQFRHPDTSVGDKISQLGDKLGAMVTGKGSAPVPPNNPAHSPTTPASPAALAVASSSGLEVSLVSLRFSESNVYATLTIKSMLQEKVYLSVVQGDDSGRLILGSGGQTYYPTVAGIASCGNNMGTCLNLTSYTAISAMDYLDPGAVKTISLKYGYTGELKSNETASFTLSMIGRFVRSGSPDPQPAEQIRFNIPAELIAR